MRKLFAFGATWAAALLSTLSAQAQTAVAVTPAQATGAAFAPQGAIEEVVVTARRRPEDAQKVPAAITAISGNDIRVDRIQSAQDLQNFAPSLAVAAQLGSRDQNVFTIRGQSQPFGGADPGVQTYFAEVPFNAGGSGNDYDLENIQVLNGPQGTLFGRNTTGGAVLFEPTRPTLDAMGGYIDASLGNYAMKQFQAALNLPIGDTLAIRIAGDTEHRDGYTRDVTNGEDLDDENYGSFRVSALWQPTAHFSNYAVFDYLEDHNKGTGAELTGINTNTFNNLATQFLGAPCTVPPTSAQCGALEAFEGELVDALHAQQGLGPRKTMSDIPLFYRRASYTAVDIARYDINDDLYIRNIFGYVVDKEQPAFDYDGSALPILDIPNSRAWESNTYQVTEEVQLGGKSFDDHLNWLFGFYNELDRPNGYSEVERETLGGAQFPGSPFFGFGNTEIDELNNGGTSHAVYGSATYDASSWVRGLSFTAGGRYTWDHKFAESRGCITLDATMPCPFPISSTSPLVSTTEQNASFRAPSWTLAANYQVTDDTMVYATYRRGYKSGGFNSGAGVAATAFGEFQPEYLTDVELGTKNNWTILGVPGRTNFDVYYGWYDNVQKNDEIPIELILPNPAGPTPPNPPITEIEPAALTFNAARAHIEGAEFQSTFVPDSNFEVNMFYSYTDATYDRFDLPQAIIVNELTGTQTLEGTLNHAGSPFAFTPKNKFGITPRFHIPIDESLGQPYLSGTVYYQSKEEFTDLSDIEVAQVGQPPVQKDYTLLDLRFDWENFMGKPFDLSLFMDNVTNRTYKVGDDALLHLTGTSASIYGPPRMYGIELRYRFGADANGG